MTIRFLRLDWHSWEHRPWAAGPSPDPALLERIGLDIARLRAADRLDGPCIHVSDGSGVEQRLRDHPEIDWLVCMFPRRDGDEQERERARLTEVAGGRLNYIACDVDDADERTTDSPRCRPRERDVRPVLDFLLEWRDAGCPPLLVHCAAGRYRSMAVALAAGCLAGLDPGRAALRLAMSDRLDHPTANANWVIGDIMDRLIGLEGRLSHACRQMESAVRRRARLWQAGASFPEVARAVRAALAHPVQTSMMESARHSHPHLVLVPLGGGRLRIRLQDVQPGTARRYALPDPEAPFIATDTLEPFDGSPRDEAGILEALADRLAEPAARLARERDPGCPHFPDGAWAELVAALLDHGVEGLPPVTGVFHRNRTFGTGGRPVTPPLLVHDSHVLDPGEAFSLADGGPDRGCRAVTGDVIETPDGRRIWIRLPRSAADMDTAGIGNAIGRALRDGTELGQAMERLHVYHVPAADGGGALVDRRRKGPGWKSGDWEWKRASGRDALVDLVRAVYSEFGGEVPYHNSVFSHF